RRMAGVCLPKLARPGCDAASIDDGFHSITGAILLDQLFRRQLAKAIARSRPAHISFLGHAARSNAVRAGVFPCKTRFLLAPRMRFQPRNRINAAGRKENKVAAPRPGFLEAIVSAD